jgi:succinyl-diaminopimelate desuccinylase
MDHHLEDEMTTPPLMALAEAARDRIVDFGRRLLQAPSLSSQEGDVAALVAAELCALGLAEVWTDAVGNVIGRLPGGDGISTMLHSHMDIVDPGDVTRWRYAPFAGHLEDGYLWGRGAVDDKGSLTAMVYAMGLLHEAGLRPAGEVLLAAVVNEENGGLGTRCLLREVQPGVAIIGEPSGNTVRRGHRGRFEFVVTLRGRSVHASVPDLGLNPHYSMARFLLALREAPMRLDPVFKGSTVAPTLGYVDQTSSNVIPAEATIHLDWRTTPGETVEEARGLLEQLLAASIEPGITYDLRVHGHLLRSYTGHQEQVLHDPISFCRDRDDAILQAVHGAVEAAVAHPVPVDVWAFCTDGSYLAAAGVPCVGYGPGDEHMAHVLDERIAVDEIVEATAAYMGLALKMGAVTR